MEAKLPVSKTDCWLTHNTYVKQPPQLHGSEVEGILTEQPRSRGLFLAQEHVV